MSYLFSFENLQVWQDTRSLIKGVYVISKKFPDDEKFGLTNQIRRAAISVSSNLAEGSARVTDKDKAYFYNMAYSSLMEVFSQLIIASDLQYINQEVVTEHRTLIEKISSKINALRKATLEKKN